MADQQQSPAHPEPPPPSQQSTPDAAEAAAAAAAAADLPPPPASAPAPSPALSSGPPMKPPPQMTRPGPGRSGKRIQLFCNHFAVAYTGGQDSFQYTVSITIPLGGGDDKSISNKNDRRLIMSKVSELYGQQELGGKRFAYDGESTLYTVGPLPFQSQEFTILLDDSAFNKSEKNTDGGDGTKRSRISPRGRDYKVKLEYVATVKMGAIMDMLRGQRNDRAQDAVRVLDIVLRQHSASKGYMLINDNYFSTTFGVEDIGEGVQTCKGYHVSIRPSLQGLSLNLDTATTTVLKPVSVLEFIKSRFNPQSPKHIDWEKAKKYLKGVKVETPHTNMIHRIVGFSPSSCAEQTFVRKKVDESGNPAGTEITIQEYYKIHYNMSLKYPELPCIAAGKKNKPTYVPVELCRIVEGQRYTKPLTSNQRQKMIDQARQRPEQRQSVLQKAMEISDYASNSLLRDFNIKIDSRMKQIAGRVLDTPALMFGKGFEETPRGGRWNFNTKVVADPGVIRTWVVLNFNSRMPQHAVERVARELAGVCAKKGLTMPAPEFIVQEPHQNANLPPAQRVQRAIDEVKGRLRTRPPDFMLCILPMRKTSDIYGPLKKLVQTKLNIITQCISPPTPVKDQYLTNVALKINAKMGGINSFLSMEAQCKLPKVSQVPTVIFGMDVSHGNVGFSDSPSIAAVVASREWPNISKYGVRLKAQPRKVEMISGLYEESGSGGMVAELLKDFYGSCKPMPGVTDRRPRQVIIFRDGVSESQFEQVLREEYLAFKKAFNHLDKRGDYNPKITFIVVQKRHHTRFFNVGPSQDKSGNVAPGTIVDEQLCHPKDYDFYLCAHAGLIGTTRPTHYHVLVDENNFSVDELQNLTHSLCYTYARSTTAVSTVAPVAYAHLAAAHGRNFLDSDDGGSDTSSMQARRSNSEQPINFAELHPNMQDKMFFC